MAERGIPPERDQQRPRHPSLASRLALHSAALAVVLVCGLAYVGADATFSSDEGAAVAQAKSLADDGTWFLAHPFPAADPDGVAFPLEKSARGDGGFAPLPKQLVYPLLLSLVDRLGGVTGMVLLSIGGTVAASIVAGLLAEQMRSGLGPPALWMTGLASPLVVDGYLVYAHSIAAAVAGACVLCLVRAHRRMSGVAAASAVVLAVVGALLRNEMVLMAVAIGTASMWVGRSTRSRILAVGGVGVAIAGPSGRIIGKALENVLLGTGGSIGQSATGGGDLGSAPAASAGGLGAYLRDRADALLTTVFRPAYDLGATSVVAICLVLVGLIACLALRRRPVDIQLLRVCAAAVLVLAGLRFVLPGPDPQVVPGLLVAFPALSWGLALLDRAALGRPEVRLALGGWVVFVGLVAATQYRQGGSWEWGGRYFAAGLALVAPVVVLAFARAAQSVPREVATPLAAALVVASVSSAAIGVGAVHRSEELTAGLVAAVTESAMATRPGDGGPPVIVTTQPELPRSAWASLDDDRWLLVDAGRLTGQLDALAGLGIDEVVLATRRGEDAARQVRASTYNPVDPLPEGATDAWWITVLER